MLSFPLEGQRKREHPGSAQKVPWREWGDSQAGRVEMNREKGYSQQGDPDVQRPLQECRISRSERKAGADDGDRGQRGNGNQPQRALLPELGLVKSSPFT